jgi:hypothetical protein
MIFMIKSSTANNRSGYQRKEIEEGYARYLANAYANILWRCQICRKTIG